MINSIQSNTYFNNLSQANKLKYTNKEESKLSINSSAERRNAVKHNDKKIATKRFTINDSEAVDIFNQYGKSLVRTEVGENFYLYDVSSLAEEFEIPIANPNILDTRDQNGNRELRLIAKYPDTGQEVNIQISLIGYGQEESLSEDVLKDDVIKAFKMMSKSLMVKDGLGDTQLHSYGSFINYSEAEKTFDLDSFSNLIIEDLDLRKKAVFAKTYNGDMNLMVDKMTLIKAKQDLEQYFFELSKDVEASKA
jgi:hypothetical protein